MMNRRKFVAAVTSGLFIGRSLATSSQADEGETRKPATADLPPLQRICLFTDLLDDSGFSYAEVAGVLRQLRIAGPDLTVRQGGLIAPEAAAEELPKADRVFREHGLSIPMLTTGITSAGDPSSATILRTMNQLGIRFYKLGYFRYHDYANWKNDVEKTWQQLAGLVPLNEEFKLEAGFHNHAGDTVGGAMWDLVMLLEHVKSPTVGVYFDAAHATIEGSESGWQLGFHRLAPRLKILAVKDFIREKSDGRWRVRWCPLGQGMVRWPEFFALLRKVSFQGPISLHIEYDPGGNTKMERLHNSLQAAERDLAFLRERIREAYGDAAGDSP